MHRRGCLVLERIGSPPVIEGVAEVVEVAAALLAARRRNLAFGVLFGMRWGFVALEGQPSVHAIRVGSDALTPFYTILDGRA